MAAFLSGQLDFILFFYGMAFLLLAATCWAGARGQDDGKSWAVLGAFAFAHGIGEWLDLTALIVGDTPRFALARTTLMTASFILLLEFARLQGIRLSWRLPGRWIYALLALGVLWAGVVHGVITAGIVARYGIGFVSALGASLVLASRARQASGGARRFALLASAGFALYALAAGIIVPAGPFWPSTILNYRTFTALTGLPIQLVRGLLACLITFSIWAIWGERHTAEVASLRYTIYVRQQFIWMLVVMGSILVSGWMLTEHLGVIYRDKVQEQANASIDLLASRLSGDTATIEGMVKALAGSPSVLPLLNGGGPDDHELGQSVLDLNIEAAGATRG